MLVLIVQALAIEQLVIVIAKAVSIVMQNTTCQGVTCRALPDTGPGRTYVSNRLAEEIGKKQIKCEQRQIDIMMSSASKKVEVYSFEVSNTQETFNLKVDVTKVEKGNYFHYQIQSTRNNQ